MIVTNLTKQVTKYDPQIIHTDNESQITSDQSANTRLQIRHVVEQQSTDQMLHHRFALVVEKSVVQIGNPFIEAFKVLFAQLTHY